jgi:hypothetical protein
MIIGIMADTHDRLSLVNKAVKVLNEQNVELVLHAGDYIAPFVIPRFKPLKAKLIGVFGNNDGEKDGLKRKFEEIGAEIRGSFADVRLDGLKIALLHGSEEELLRSLIDAGSYDIVIHGHTHEAKIYKEGKTLVVNPGEVCAYLTDRSTIALLNSRTKEAKIVEL